MRKRHEACSEIPSETFWRNLALRKVKDEGCCTIPACSRCETVPLGPSFGRQPVVKHLPYVRNFPEEVRVPKWVKPVTTEMTELFWSPGMMVESVTGVASYSPLSTVEDE